MTKYIVKFEFRTDAGEWRESDLSNNGNGWTLKEAEDIARQLREQDKQNVRIEAFTKAEKKYTVWYTSGATGYGWKEEYDRLDEFESFIDQMRNNYTAKVHVWDKTLQDFIFWKDCLSYKPDIDMLGKFGRDMRAKTRQWK